MRVRLAWTALCAPILPYQRSGAAARRRAPSDAAVENFQNRAGAVAPVGSEAARLCWRWRTIFAGSYGVHTASDAYSPVT